MNDDWGANGAYDKCKQRQTNKTKKQKQVQCQSIDFNTEYTTLLSARRTGVLHGVYVENQCLCGVMWLVAPVSAFQSVEASKMRGEQGCEGSRIEVLAFPARAAASSPSPDAFVEVYALPPLLLLKYMLYHLSFIIFRLFYCFTLAPYSYFASTPS